MGREAGGDGKILVLTDGKAGHENQSRAFVRALGREADVVRVRFRSRLAKALSYPLSRVGAYLPSLLDGLDFAALRRENHAAVVGTGSGTFYAAKTAAKALGARCCAILYPRGYDVSAFDCVLAPSFDRPRPAANVVEIPANVVSADPDFYRKGVADFLARSGLDETEILRRGAVAAIVGGPNAHSTMTPEWMEAQLDEVFSEPPSAAGEKPFFFVTTSRRTPPEVEAAVDARPWDWKLIYSRDTFNPIPAFVALARKLYVTAESTGMLSEACTAGTAEIVAMDDLKPGPSKFRRFLDGLRAGGHVGGSRKIDISAQIAKARSLLGL